MSDQENVDDLLGGSVDGDYDEEFDEDALLADNNEEKVNESDDVLDLEVDEEVDLEESFDNNKSEKERSLRFKNERSSPPTKGTTIPDSLDKIPIKEQFNNKKVQKQNLNRNKLRNKKGNFQNRQRFVPNNQRNNNNVKGNTTVHINPNFKGNVHVGNDARFLLNSRKSDNRGYVRHQEQQQQQQQHQQQQQQNKSVALIQPWAPVSPLPNDNFVNNYQQQNYQQQQHSYNNSNFNLNYNHHHAPNNNLQFPMINNWNEVPFNEVQYNHQVAMQTQPPQAPPLQPHPQRSVFVTPAINYNPQQNSHFSHPNNHYGIQQFLPYQANQPPIYPQGPPPYQPHYNHQSQPPIHQQNNTNQHYHQFYSNNNINSTSSSSSSSFNVVGNLMNNQIPPPLIPNLQKVNTNNSQTSSCFRSGLPKRWNENNTNDQRWKKRVKEREKHLQQVVIENNTTEQNNVVKVVEEEDELTKDLRRQIEKQKRKREEVLRLKEERRRQAAAMKNQLNNNNNNNKKVLIGNESIINETTSAPTATTSSSSFFTNRKVLAKDESLPETSMVVVSNLAAGTKAVKLRKLCTNIGNVQKLQMSPQERQATIKFNSVASAHAFFKKYQRFMLDLSMIQVTLKQ